MLSHISHSAAHGKDIRSRVKVGKEVPNPKLGQAQPWPAALAIDESTGS